MVKLNSNTAILSDLDGVILNLDYDIKFWESRLPEHLSSQSNQSLEEIKTKIHAEIDIQRGTLNFYDHKNLKFLFGYQFLRVSLF